MFNEDILEKNVSVSVQWNGQYDIDDPTDTYVTLYKCSVNGGSCSLCLSEGATPSILGCGWCDDDCNVIRSDVCQNNQFLSQNDTKLCAAPVISDFYPLSVAINAQTRLEITGTDLGVEFDDVLEIVIGDLMCSLTDMGSFYQPGQSVSCMTGLSTGVISGRIEITVRSGESIKTGESSTEFLYRDPIISGFSPTEGQVAGGTEITVTGMYLNTGRNIEASFGEAQCNNLIVDDTTVLCITSSLQMNEQIAVPLTMTFDGLVKRFEDYSFIYNPNPIINGKYRTESILSGGLDIKLTGQRFDLIQEPRIIVSSLTTDASNSKLCNGTETILICPTPSFPDDGISTRRRRATNGVMTANLTFDFDGYIVDGGLIEYYPDPMYESFSGPNRIYASSNGRLDITGINLDLASTEDDVQVLLGPNGVCHVDVLEIDVVRCQLPEKQPLAGYENGSLGQGPSKNLPAVTVLHGNVRFSPGFVSAWATEGNPLIAIVIPVVIVVPIWIIIPLIFLVWWFRKKQLEVKRAKEEVKMIRMNILKRVREVSNTSLDLSEADDRVQKQGVPFVGHVQYVTMMLFAGLGIHPETTEPEYMEDFMEHSLVSFYRMLKEKAGLIEFIRQLENKKTGQGRERELIASLLAITFVSEGKSIHFTSVLTSLVEDEIVTASESRRRMDTLFTNTESIAVKLISNWFALFMFEYLKMYGVYPLYMLYQAVKAQAEKGPIDVVTGDAYYTLEFSKLLDQEIDFHSLGIDVVDEDGHIYLHMTVLDVDTVKQAKQKILDSLWKKSYCLLPRDIDAVDLVWIQTSGRTTLLQDIDKSSETQGKTMINTMKSIGIRNGSHVALIPKNHGDEYQTLDLKEVSSKTCKTRHT
ncbi:plexin-A4 [Strongylocentrotus purpuratus]|uniref:IPT/TIG domain-containing protein n=1 Tax=Strongylocentrotus purpuratus TaxID=7668 RepID=A0A7M7NMH8_STRPU|nr:plexin-A4 [Strongylocentrotus purpuratus]